MTVALDLALDLAFLAACLFVGVQLVVALVNTVTFPRLYPSERVSGAGGSRPSISLLLPVRNEAATLPDTLPRLLAQGADEVVVVDDRSTDRTGEILSALAHERSDLRILEGSALPSGWTGKNWACQQLAEAARGDVWIFTDADVEWHDGALDALLAQWSPSREGFASVWPRQRCVGWIERIAVPQVDLVLLGGLPWPGVQRLPVASLTAGNGQLMAWTREAYRATGGHAAVQAMVLEDVRMAQRAKSLGIRPFLALGRSMLSTRMYRSGSEVLDGFAKNVLPAAGSWAALLVLWLLNVVAYLAAWPLAWIEVRWLIVAVGGLVFRGLVARAVGRSWTEAVWQPAAPVALTAIVARVAARRGGYVWRGRSYGREGT